MPCFKPFFKQVRATTSSGVSQSIPCPCGHCPFCRYRMAKTWSLRLELEAMQHSKTCFLTLTYDNCHLRDNSLHPEHLTSFWKRLRYYVEQKYGTSYKIKYFSCGEYGDKFGRPHYHAVLFGLNEEDEDIILKAWNQGFIHIGTLTEKSIKYVTGYALKKLGKDKIRFQRDTRWPEFIRSSQGLGSWIINQIPHFTPFIMLNGKLRYLGRYLTTKLMFKFYPYMDLETRRNPLQQIQLESYLTQLDDLMYKYKDDYDGLDDFIKTQYSLLQFSYENDTIQFKRDFIAKFKTFKRIANEKIEIQSFAY